MCSHLRRSTLPKQHCTEIVALLLNAAPASREHKSGPVHSYINSSDGAETVAPLFIFCRIINMFTKADNLPTTIQCCVQHLRASRLFLIKWKVCGFLFLFFKQVCNKHKGEWAQPTVFTLNWFWISYIKISVYVNKELQRICHLAVLPGSNCQLCCHSFQLLGQKVKSA